MKGSEERRVRKTQKREGLEPIFLRDEFLKNLCGFTFGMRVNYR